jgi:hypothetical protein
MLVKVADWIVDQYEQLQTWVSEQFDDDPRKADAVKTWIVIACIVAVTITVILLIWLVVTVLGGPTLAVAQGLAAGLGWALERVADWNLTEVVTKPVHDYITAHAAGLPAGAEAIWSAWTLTGPILWLICLLTKSSGARLAWVLYGAGTVAMVYSASPVGGHLLATGVAVVYWAVLSVFVFRRIGRRPVVHVHSAPDVTTPLQQLRQQLDEQLSEVRARIGRVEVASDELAARRVGSRDDEDS